MLTCRAPYQSPGALSQSPMSTLFCVDLYKEPYQPSGAPCHPPISTLSCVDVFNNHCSFLCWLPQSTFNTNPQVTPVTHQYTFIIFTNRDPNKPACQLLLLKLKRKTPNDISRCLEGYILLLGRSCINVNVKCIQKIKL